MRRLIRLSVTAAAAALAAIAVAAPASAASSAAKPAHVHSMAKFNPFQRPGGGGGGPHVNNLTYHGGPVETSTSVYLIYWGSAWSTGFTTGGYTSAKAQTYVHDFFTNVGGSNWIGTDTQYCQGAASGATSCGSGTTHVGNPTGQLKGVWVDSATNPPANNQIQDSNLANEAVRSITVHGFPYDANATYLVFTPTGDSESGFAANGGGWCAWHSDTSSSVGTVNFGYIPYMPDAGGSCGVDFINSNDTYGHGYFDGFSVVAGHEYEEAQTDPHLNAWYDSRGSENADKCAWNALSGNTALGTTNYWAVQPVWSNAIGGCAAVSST